MLHAVFRNRPHGPYRSGRLDWRLDGCLDRVLMPTTKNFRDQATWALWRVAGIRSPPFPKRYDWGREGADRQEVFFRLSVGWSNPEREAGGPRTRHCASDVHVSGLRRGRNDWTPSGSLFQWPTVH